MKPTDSLKSKPDPEKVKVLITQSYLTLCHPMDCSLPSSSVRGILQARIVEWLTIPFSRESSWPRDWTWVSLIAGRFFAIWARGEALPDPEQGPAAAAKSLQSCPTLQQQQLLLSRFSPVRLCATPQMAAHQAPRSLGFSSQEDWSGLPFPSPMHESEKWKWSRSVVSDSSWPRGLQTTRLLLSWIFQARVLEWVAIAVSGTRP